MKSILTDLKERNLISNSTEESAIISILEKGSSVYCGFDPTAKSLHVGSLLPLITLKRFALHGVPVIALLGGATGLIGDPSGKSQERTLNDNETVISFKNGIKAQISSIVNEATLVDNLDWTSPISMLDFLRDVGKHFSINTMLQKDSVKNRVAREDQGISFTEFSYQILQSMDFLHLMLNHNCCIQIGGSDQWGNITAGIEFIHKKAKKAIVGGITLPLLTKSDGTKFGKSESGAVWLSPELTSPFDFFQFWLNISDSDLENLFLKLSLRPVTEIQNILSNDQELIKQGKKPQGQFLLATELTTLIHGEKATNAVLMRNQALFTTNFNSFTEEDWNSLIESGIPTLKTAEINLVNILIETKFATSKREAREFLSNGAISLNGVKNTTIDIEPNQWQFNKFAILKKGKNKFCLLVKKS